MQVLRAHIAESMHIVMEYAVAFQARRNMLELREGEEDTMEPLPHDTVQRPSSSAEQVPFAAGPGAEAGRGRERMGELSDIVEGIVARRAPPSAPKAGEARRDKTCGPSGEA